MSANLASNADRSYGLADVLDTESLRELAQIRNAGCEHYGTTMLRVRICSISVSPSIIA